MYFTTKTCGSRIRSIILLISVVSVSGCGSESSSQTGPVAGIVTMDGQALADADVYFVSGEFTAFGRTSAYGQFMLAQGALPGVNRVFVTKSTGGDPSLFVPGYGGDGLDDGQLQAVVAAMGADTTLAVSTLPRSVVPPEFSNPEETRLSFLVPETGTQSASLQLTSR